MKYVLQKIVIFLVKRLIINNRNFRLELLSVFPKYFGKTDTEDSPITHFSIPNSEMIEASLNECFKFSNLKKNNTNIFFIRKILDKELNDVLQNNPERKVD